MEQEERIEICCTCKSKFNVNEIDDSGYIFIFGKQESVCADCWEIWTNFL